MKICRPFYRHAAALLAAVGLSLTLTVGAAAQGRAHPPAVAALRALTLDQLDLRKPAGAAFRDRFLTPGAANARQNGCSDDAPASFDSMCHSYGSDLALPDLILGIENQHIAVAVLPGANGQPLGRDWRCRQVVADQYALCFPTFTDIATEMRWTDELTAYLNAAN